MPDAPWDPEQEAGRFREAFPPWNARWKTVPPPGRDPGEPGVMPIGTSAEADTISVPGAAAGADPSGDPGAPRGPTPLPVSVFPTPSAALFRGGFPRLRG